MNEEDEKILRELIWLNHGCPFSVLYGDDGEMQCNKCMIDFKRDSAKEIKTKIMNKNYAIYQDQVIKHKD